MLDAERLRSFVVFAETLNFTRAAEARNISQPALFAQVARLSEEVGRPLYRREGRRLHLTAAGRRVEAFGRELIARTENFLANVDGSEHAPVTVAAGAGAYLDLLSEGLQAFVRTVSAPPQLLVANGPGVREHVERGIAMVGVVAGEARHDLKTTALATVPMTIAMPRRHVLAKRRRVRIEHLLDEPMIVPPAEGPLRRRIDTLFWELGSKPPVAVEASGWPLTLEFVRMGLGVAIVNGNVRLPTGLVARPIAGFAPVTYTILERREGTLKEGVRLVKTLLKHRRAWRRRARTAWALSRQSA